MTFDATSLTARIYRRDSRSGPRSLSQIESLVTIHWRGSLFVRSDGLRSLGGCKLAKSGRASARERWQRQTWSTSGLDQKTTSARRFGMSFLPLNGRFAPEAALRAIAFQQRHGPHAVGDLPDCRSSYRMHLITPADPVAALEVGLSVCVCVTKADSVKVAPWKWPSSSARLAVVQNQH
jgi:hypothetical protein